jgi:hypothetical protein
MIQPLRASRDTTRHIRLVGSETSRFEGATKDREDGRASWEMSWRGIGNRKETAAAAGEFG